MAEPKMDLTAFVGKLLEAPDGDVLREGIRVLSQALMETEVAGLIGAERHERSGQRSAYRKGSRTRTWDTRMGTIELAIPKVKPGTYFPSLLQPRRRASLGGIASGDLPRGTKATPMPTKLSSTEAALYPGAEWGKFAPIGHRPIPRQMPTTSIRLVPPRGLHGSRCRLCSLESHTVISRPPCYAVRRSCPTESQRCPS